jgi:guanylate cyclase
MDQFLLNESLIWRKARNRRAAGFLKIVAYTGIVVSLIWILLTFFLHKYLLSAILLFLMTCSVGALMLIRNNKLLPAKFILMCSWAGYFLFVSSFASGYGINNGTTHFGFILIAIVSYFLFSDLKIYREIISVFFLFVFFCFHFGYAPFYPIMVLSKEQQSLITRMDIISILLSIFLITRYFVLEINKSEEALAVSADQLEGIIGGMMPESVVKRIRKEGKTFADVFNDCSILFADIASFTQWSEKHSPDETVDHLNNIFSRFDTALEEKKLTKIKTIGDAYMVASGIPEYRPDHAQVLAELALEMQQIAGDYGQFEFRIGIHSGPTVAGIIGKKTFFFDVWGDTVNISSRMESAGEPSKINISQATYEKIKDEFICSYRGKIPAKNKGEIDMYFLEGRLKK